MKCLLDKCYTLKIAYIGKNNIKINSLHRNKHCECCKIAKGKFNINAKHCNTFIKIANYVSL